MTKKEVTILVADRNPHVREFLRRELVGEGYGVRLARNGQETLDHLETPGGIDLLILDPDLPQGEDLELLEEIRGRDPGLPIVVHAFYDDYILRSRTTANTAFVEKEGNSVDRLKAVISQVLKAGASSAEPGPFSGPAPGPAAR